jgi:hypothetical protein
MEKRKPSPPLLDEYAKEDGVIYDTDYVKEERKDSGKDT